MPLKRLGIIKSFSNQKGAPGIQERLFDLKPFCPLISEIRNGGTVGGPTAGSTAGTRCTI